MTDRTRSLFRRARNRECTGSYDFTDTTVSCSTSKNFPRRLLKMNTFSSLLAGRLSALRAHTFSTAMVNWCGTAPCLASVRP